MAVGTVSVPTIAPVDLALSGQSAVCPAAMGTVTVLMMALQRALPAWSVCITHRSVNVRVPYCKNSKIKPVQYFIAKLKQSFQFFFKIIKKWLLTHLRLAHQQCCCGCDVHVYVHTFHLHPTFRPPLTAGWRMWRMPTFLCRLGTWWGAVCALPGAL